MKSIIFITSLLALSTAFAGQNQEITCQHFAGTQIVNQIKLEYTYLNNRWDNNINVIVNSNMEDIIASDTHQGSFVSRSNYVHPAYDEVYFEPCLNCDFDGARVRFMFDDDLGLVGTLQYSSDGPMFAQILKCQEKYDF
jgi:hypothetical protein